MSDFYDNLYNSTFDVVDVIKHEFLGVKVNVPKVPNKINIGVHSRPNISWIDSPDYPGLFASGKNPVELWECLNDAIYSYFGIPRYVAKRLGNKFYLPLPDGSAIVERPREQLAGA